ncbi:MAG: ABC transporter substrate-binding protein [Dermabacter sp.]|nr:ABC transporter substrate-binding protein [Dermabacter sp.]
MVSLSRRQLGLIALLTSSSAALAACSSSGSDGAASDAGGSTASTSPTTVTVEDLRGSVTVPVPATRIVATDNRLFRTLDEWKIKLVAGPVDLMPDEVSYTSDSSILNTGNHREPNLEQLVAADPDLVLNGQRYAQYYDQIKALVPNAALVDTDIDSEKPLKDELIRQITLVGEVLAHDEEAAKLVTAFEDAITRVTKAYDPSKTVMGLITSGGDINYSAPVTGRGIGPLFPMLGLTPSLQVDGSTDHTGDDISVEAIAESNPDWIIVLDRDAAVSADEEGYQPAAELVAGSEALKNVTAVKDGTIVYMPNNFYLTEDIQVYTEFLNSFADALEKNK